MDRTGLFQLTGRLRRQFPRLPDVLAMCDEAERLARGVVSTAAPVVSTQGRNKESLSANG
jgi:hypothetical protein